MTYIFTSEYAAHEVAYTLNAEYSQRERFYIVFTEETPFGISTVVDLLGVREDYLTRPRKSEFEEVEDYYEALADWKDLEQELGLF